MTPETEEECPKNGELMGVQKLNILQFINDHEKSETKKINENLFVLTGTVVTWITCNWCTSFVARCHSHVPSKSRSCYWLVRVLMKYFIHHRRCSQDAKVRDAVRTRNKLADQSRRKKSVSFSWLNIVLTVDVIVITKSFTQSSTRNVVAVLKTMKDSSEQTPLNEYPKSIIIVI